MAGFGLRALGRTREAAEPMQASLEAAIARKDWKNAAIAAGNLSELFLTMGDLARALDYARQGVDFAGRSGDAFWRMGERTTLADALGQAGHPEEAAALFQEAEALQKENQPQYPLLYSLQGFYYCDLLLGQGEYAEVQRRAAQTLEWAEQGGSPLLTIALDHLSLGRAYLLEALHEDPKGFPKPLGSGGYLQATTHLDRAVDGLRAAGQQDDLPRGLLARAALRRAAGDFDKAQADLEEAALVAARGDMRLFQADCHLETARLCLAQADPAAARQHLDAARVIIAETGYHRRDSEVADLEGALGEG